MAAVMLAPAQASAARLKAHRFRGGVVVRLLGAKPRAVRYTLNGRTIGRSRRAPYGLVLHGYRRGRHRRPGRRRTLLVARNMRSGRRLAAIRLVRRRSPKPTVRFTSVPPATTTATSATLAFTVTDAVSTRCSRDGNTFAACASPVSLADLALGPHSLTVLATNGSGSASSSASWTVVPGLPPPPALQPVQPPAPYPLPPGALTVSTAAQLVQALGGPTRDIVVADGVYDNSGPFLNPNGDRVYAEHLGGAVFHAGFSMGGNWGPGHGVLEGLVFDVSDPSKVLAGSIVHVWGTGAGTRVADTTFDGHGVIPAGVLARQVEGLVVQRVVARNFRDWGVIVDPGNAGYTPSAAPLLEDVDSANVTWAVARGSNGTSEACVWVGVMATVRRIKTRNCAWEGLWVGSGTHDATFEDLDLNDSGIGIYVEHFARSSTFRRVYAGPNMDRGATCEWADPAWGGLPACTDEVFEDSYFDTRVIGVYLDQGTTHTTIRRSTFVHQRCGALGDYAGVGNLWDTTGNDYSGIAAGAVPVYTRHLYSC